MKTATTILRSSRAKRRRVTSLIVESLESRRLLAATSHLLDVSEAILPNARHAEVSSETTRLTPQQNDYSRPSDGNINSARHSDAQAVTIGQELNRTWDVDRRFETSKHQPPAKPQPPAQVSSRTVVLAIINTRTTFRSVIDSLARTLTPNPQPLNAVRTVGQTQSSTVHQPALPFNSVPSIFDPVSIAKNQLSNGQQMQVIPPSRSLEVSVYSSPADAHQFPYVGPQPPHIVTDSPAADDLPGGSSQSGRIQSRSRAGKRSSSISPAIRPDFATVYELNPANPIDESLAYGGLIELTARPSVLGLEYENTIEGTDLPQTQAGSDAFPSAAEQQWLSLGLWRYIEGEWTEIAPGELDGLAESSSEDTDEAADGEAADQEVVAEDEIHAVEEAFAEDWESDPELGGMIALENTDSIIKPAAHHKIGNEASIANIQLELDANIGNAIVLELMEEELLSAPEADAEASDTAETVSEIDSNAQPIATVNITSAAGLPFLLFALRRPITGEGPNSKRKRPRPRIRK